LFFSQHTSRTIKHFSKKKKRSDKMSGKNNSKNSRPIPANRLQDELNVEGFTYTQPFPNKSGTITSIYMNFDHVRPKVQSPLMYCPFGVSVLRDEKKPNAEPGFTIELSLDESSDKQAAFAAWVKDLERRVLADCKSNSNAWMKRSKLSDRMANELFNPVIRPYKDPQTKKVSDKYPPRIKFKMVRKDGNFTCRAFTGDREPIDINNMSFDDIDKLGKGCNVRIIFELGGIWCGAKGFGITLRAQQLMIYAPERLTGPGFVHDVEDNLIFGVTSADSGGDAEFVPDDGDDEEEEVNNEPAEEEEAEAVGDEAEEEVVVDDKEDSSVPTDDDDAEPAPEEEEEEEEEPEPSPEPTKKKKSTKKSSSGKQSTLAKYSKKKT
jgi:hypothetical protein